MNGNDILRAMNGLDEKYIASAKRETNVKRIKLGKGAMKIAIGLAAALALAIPVGAVYTQFIHKAAVQKYFTEESVEYLENNGLALNFVDENEHIRLTVDTLLSDGHIGSMILTIEGLDEEGLQYVKKQPFLEGYLMDAQTGEYVAIHENGSSEIIGGGTTDFDTCTETQYTEQRELQLDRIDTDKDYILTFGMNMRDNAPRDEHHVLIDNVMEGISFKTNFRPNVAVKELESDDGEKLYLSQIGIYSNEPGVCAKLRSCRELLLYRNGSIIKDKAEMVSRLVDQSPERAEPIACGLFDSIVEIDKYDGVTIGDTKYFETE